LVVPVSDVGQPSRARKDIAQAVEVLEVLLADRPGDVPAAMQAFGDQGQRHQKAMSKAVAALKKARPDLSKAVAKSW
jgi:hypothetical protein